MLLREFAMIPDVFNVSTLRNDKSLGIILVQILRALSANGLLANLYKDCWEKDVTNRIRAFPQELQEVKDKLSACLKRLHDRNRLVRHPRRGEQTPSQDIDWLKLAMESHKEIPLHGIILSKKLMKNCGLTDKALIELSEVLDSSQWQNLRRSVTLKKQKTDYRKHLPPILRHAKALTLVDPYFNTHELRFLDTIRICSELMGQRPFLERRQGQIHIHADATRQKPESWSIKKHLDSWEEVLRSLKERDKHRFKVFLWQFSSQTLHDRFILTDQCGISAPGGLDCRIQSANNTTWNLLDEEDRRIWLEKFNPAANPPYKLLDSREVGDTQ